MAESIIPSEEKHAALSRDRHCFISNLFRIHNTKRFSHLTFLAWAIILLLLPLTAHAASVSNVSSPTSNGAYRAGNSINIDLVFSDVVTVTGTPQLRLETGATDAVVNYSSGSGTNTLRFTYTVSSGHTSADLDYHSTAALSLAGGTIRNTSGAAANLTLPTPGAAGSLGANKNIQIDTTAPTTVIQALTPLITNSHPFRVQVTFSEPVSDFTPLDPNVTNGEISGLTGSGNSYTLEITPYTNGNVTVQIPASSAFDPALNGNTASSTITFLYDTNFPNITGVTSTPVTGAYRAGQNVNLVVVFSEPVTVTGIPSFTVETGVSDGVANYFSGSGTNQLTFQYTVQTGHNSADLEYTASDSLVLNGGSIRDLASNNAILNLPPIGSSTSLSTNANVTVDTIIPDVVISSPISGTTSLDAIPVEVIFSEPVSGFSLSDFSVANGCASNLRGSGTTYFADIVPRAHGTVTVSIPGAAAFDVAGNPNTAAPTPVVVNFLTSGPKVTSVTSSTPNGAYKAGQMISIQVSFSDPVIVTGTPQLRLATGSIATVDYTSGSGTDTLTFEYTIAPGQNSNDLDYIPLPPLALSGGQIRDLATATFDAAFTFACPGASGSLSHAKNIIVDTIAPTISRVTSTTANGAYRAGRTLNVQTQFSENVFVTGTPTLTLETGPNDPVISMVSGSGSANLDFSYTVVDGHNSNRLDYTNTGAFSLNGSTIVDHAGNVAVTTLPAPGSTNSLFGQKNLIIDTIPPIVPNVTSTTANGSYKAGTLLNVQVAFSEVIYVTGTPRLALAAGVPNRFATFSSGSASSTLNFSYTVSSGDTALDLDYTGISALDTNGGSLRDLAGNDAIVSLAQPGTQFSLSFNKNLQLDTTAPSIVEVRSTTPNGAYSIGATIPISVVFSEPVNVTGTPFLTLNTVPTQATATYLSGSGTSILTFLYTVAAGHNSSNLDYSATNSLLMPVGASIRDPATNDANVTLAAPGTSGSLAAQGQRIIDTTVPTLIDISYVTSNGFYRAGSQIDINLIFSENIYLSGALNLQLATASGFGRASCISLVTPSTLRCSYTVQPGDNSPDLDYQASTSLTLSGSGAALNDIALNSADLTLPNPGSSTSLAGKSSIVLDTISPVATLSSTTQSTTNLNPIVVTLIFNEPVSGVTSDDLTVANGTVQNLTGSGTTYTLELVPLSDGLITLELQAGAALDTAGNLSATSQIFQRTYDSVRPTVRIDSSAAQTSNTNSIPASITFSEAVTGFELADISVTNGTIALFAGSGATYSIEVLPTSDGPVELFIQTDVAIDAGGNGNQSSDTLSRFYDSTPPEVRSVRSSTPNGYYRAGELITIEVVFSEPIYVTGSPSLILATDTNIINTTTATYLTGEGTNTLQFRYTVRAGDNSADLDYQAINSLQLSSSTIKDLATNSAVVLLPIPGSSQSLAGQNQIVIDTQAPEEPRISVPSTDSLIQRAHIEVRGVAEPSSTVIVSNVVLGQLCEATTSDQGDWSCVVSNLADGAYQITAISEDRAGNTSSPSDQVNFTVDLFALDAPVFTAPDSGMSTETSPTFVGTAPANKKVRVRLGSATLCLADVSVTGSWSCQSTSILSAGRHQITGTTEDPGDLTTSAATPLALTIGTRIVGIVLYANRDLTPFRGVSVSDTVLSTSSGADGVFSLVVPEPSDPKLILSKYGWRIKRSETLSPRAIAAGASIQWLATPTLEAESFTIWSGNMENIRQLVRVLNKSSELQTVTATLYQSDGSVCSEVISSSISPRSHSSLELSQSPCFRQDAYGLVKIAFPNQEYDATLVNHHRSGSFDRYLSSFNELPLANPVMGKSYHFFDNAYHRIRKGTESFSMRNELLVSNVSSSPQSFTVRRYLSNGSLSKTLRFTIPAKGSYMVPFIRSEENIPQNGIQEVEPDNAQAPYLAVMIRTGAQSPHLSDKNREFTFMNYAEVGSAGTRFARVRYLPKKTAVQYAEIANVTSQPLNVRIKRIGRTGKARPTIPLLLSPHETRKIRLSRLLDRYEEGVAEISSDASGSIIIANVTKHYRADKSLLSVKSLAVQETFGDLAYGSYSRRQGLDSILKVTNLGVSSGSLTVACYANSQLIDATQLSLQPGRIKQIGLAKCFKNASNGTIEVNSSNPGSFVIDQLRYRAEQEISLGQRLR
ncbi:MAG: Ig-like domain-containing protein [Pseudomonadota bacterium]